MILRCSALPLLKGQASGLQSQIPWLAIISRSVSWKVAKTVGDAKRYKREKRAEKILRLPGIFAYNEEKLHWVKQFKALRLLWFADWKEKRKLQLREERRQRAEESALERIRVKQILAEHKKQTLYEQVQKAELQFCLARQAFFKAQQRDAKEKELEKLWEDRRKTLLEDSRSWITEERLSERILEAIDNPATFPMGLPQPVRSFVPIELAFERKAPRFNPRPPSTLRPTTLDDVAATPSVTA